MVSGSFSRNGGSIGLAFVLAVSSLVLVAVESPQAVSASTGCTSGSVSTTTEIGRNYLGESDEFVSAPRVSSDRKLHRYTKVTFTSNGVSDASCTWVAPAGVTTGQVLAVGGGGAGGTYFGGGGGGGAMYLNKLPVITPGQSYAITVGIGGASVPISCLPNCNGGNGHASQIENIGWAGGGSGGGGNTNESLGSYECTSTDANNTSVACGGGGGAAAPIEGGQLAQNRPTSHGVPFGAAVGTMYYQGGGSQKLAVTEAGGDGGVGIADSYILNTSTALEYLSGGGGGAGYTNANGKWGSGDSLTCGTDWMFNCALGASGWRMPFYPDSVSISPFGGGGGGLFINAKPTRGSRLQGVFSFSSSQFKFPTVPSLVTSSGGASASYNPLTASGTAATAGLANYGGGGGAGGGILATDGTITSDATLSRGGNGGSGVVSIIYYERPEISGGQSTLTTSFGVAASTEAFSAAKGNLPITQDMSLSSTPTYTWSVTNTSGSALSGISVDSSGVVSVAADKTVGIYEAVVKATDGIGSTTSVPLTIEVTKRLQTPLYFFFTTAPVNPHIGAPIYQPWVNGGSSTRSKQITIDPSSTSVCSITGNNLSQYSVTGKVSFIGVGNCILNVEQPGDANYEAARLSQTVVVTPRDDQTPLAFTSTAPVNHHVGGTPYTVTVSGGSSSKSRIISIDETSSTVCSISGTTSGSAVTFTEVGDCIINVDQAGDYNYNSAHASQTVTVTARSSQAALSVTTPTGAYVGLDFIPVVSGGSGDGQVTISLASYSSPYCSISGVGTDVVITALAVGSCVMLVNKAADYNYDAASEVTRLFMIYETRSLAVDVDSYQKVYQYLGTTIDVLPTVKIDGSFSPSYDMRISDETTKISGQPICNLTSKYDLHITGVGTCKFFAIDTDNRYFYSQSPMQTIYVVAPGDTTLPTVTSVAGFRDGVYSTGQKISILVTMSERVIVTGTPRIQLNTGASGRYANYVSGNYADTLLFEYTAQAGDQTSDLDYANVSALQLNGGSIDDFSANSAVITLVSPGSAGSLGYASSIGVNPAAATTTTTTSTTTTTVPVASGLTPTFSNAVPLVDGFTFIITNFSADYTYFLAVSRGSISRTNEVVTVTGVDPGETVGVLVITDRIGYAQSDSSLTAAAATTTTTTLSPTTTVVQSTTTSSVAPEVSTTTTVAGISQVTTTTIAGVSTTVAPTSGSVAESSPAIIVSAPSGSGGVATIVAFVAPVVTRVLLIGKSTTIKSLATYFKLVVPSGAKLSARIASSSGKICRIVSTSVKALKKGTCTLSITMKPKKGKSLTKSGKILVK
ncbi:hypothetical protein GM51_11350 [freshwater metagenome]|uniref:Glycine-rich domain-containing protein n=1 Tax=freshwater metagenome TaxID=449393 RepID=A0A094QQS9_9ZZZZ